MGESPENLDWFVTCAFLKILIISHNFTVLLRHVHNSVKTWNLIIAIDILVGRLEKTSREKARSSAVITHPSEIFTVFHVLTHTRRRSSVFAIFDSHPRPSKGVNRASLFPTLADRSDYITGLLQRDPSLLSGGLQWEVQPLNHYSGHVFLTSNSYNFDVDDMRSM
ncbi:hypothetical protein JB92DRAFT_414108 [Gautieria morchelliformis]|nr:hypothetical protein JB92DRAFT_466579 [Gautieria morchelliformis]KAF8530782.1 hypothetical protein JB92DRAFT_414108 [Gautieria morchelliformis]